MEKVKGKLTCDTCNLCIIEKMLIISNLDNDNMLNKKNEFVSKCRHLNKNMIASIRSDSMD